MDKLTLDSRRRQFLTVAACAPALAVAALLTKEEAPIAEAAAPTVPNQPVDGRGYHETEHIRKYYYTAAYF